MALATFSGCSPSGVSSSEFSGNDSSSGSTSDLVTTISIAYLKSLYAGSSLLITNDIAIEGVITANDGYGEYPSSIIIEESSGAIEIKCDLDCAISGYVIGATVQVKCSGMWLGSTGGMLSLGGAPYDQVATSELTEEEMLRMVVVTDDEYITPTPTTVTIPYIDQSYILRYVQLHNLSFVRDDDSATTFCTRDEDTGLTQYTDHTLSDLQGNTITLCVDRNVRYADDTLPTSPTTLSCIVEYFSGEYRLRIVNCGY